MVIILIVALVVAGGAGTAVISDNSLPGDTLYAVKVNVNEKLMATFSFGAEAKAKTAAKLADRRLNEAEKLAVENRLSADLSAGLKDRLKLHANDVHVLTAELEAENKDLEVSEVNSEFESRLRGHERILVRMQSSNSEAQGEINALLQIVRDNESVAAAASARAEAKVVASGGPEVEAAARGKLKAAENKLEEVSKFISNLKARSEAQITEEAETRLEVARNTVAAGKVKLEAAVYGEAFQMFQKAIRIASEAQVLAAAKNELKANVRADGSIGVSVGSEGKPGEEKQNEAENAGTEGEDIDADAEVETEAGTGTGTGASGRGKLDLEVGL